MPGGAVVQPKELSRIQCGSGHTKRDGRWVVPQRIEVGVTSGNVKLDFTEAIITGGTLRIDADVRSGQLLLVTRPGIVVDADDVSVSSGSILARPPRRTFWQWLRREQRPYQSARG